MEVEVERVGQALSVCDDTSRGERCSSSRGVVLVNSQKQTDPFV